MPAQKWRNAATAMVVRKSQEASFPFDWQILMMKRAKTAKFMPNAAVFPGGAVDKADLDVKSWKKLFENVHGSTDFENMKNRLKYPIQPEMYQPGHFCGSEKFQSADDFPNWLVFRLTAIRELVEESGVLVSTDGVFEVSSEERNMIYNNPESFVSFCAEKRIAPDLERLYEWSDWLTPTNILPKRFDTMFYLITLDEDEAENVTFQHDGSELLTTEWLSPHQVLHRNMLEKEDEQHIHLHPPQSYELSRMMNFRQWLQLQGYARVRPAKFGSVRWLPMVVMLRKGLMMSVMHDDYLYPEDPDVMGDGARFSISDVEIEKAIEIFEDRQVPPGMAGVDRTYWDKERFNLFQMTNYSGPGISWMARKAESKMLSCGQIPSLNINEWPQIVREI